MLPTPWLPCRATGSDDVLYFNPASGERRKSHPLDAHWSQLFVECFNRVGPLFQRNRRLTRELHGPVTSHLTQASFDIDGRLPLGAGITADAAVETVAPGGQAARGGVLPGSQLVSIGGADVDSLASVKAALRLAREGGGDGGALASSSSPLTVTVAFQPPLAAAVARAELEHLCDPALVERARRRIAKGPNGPDAAAEEFVEEESGEEEEEEEESGEEEEEEDDDDTRSEPSHSEDGDDGGDGARGVLGE